MNKERLEKLVEKLEGLKKVACCVEALPRLNPDGLIYYDTNVRIKVRLESSKSGGDYWILLQKDNIVWKPSTVGLNRARYEPKFDVFAAETVRVQIVKELLDNLVWDYVKVDWGDNEKETLYFPIRRDLGDVSDFDLILVVGNCPATGTDFTDVRDWGNRVNEVYYMKDVVDLYMLRKEVVELLEEEEVFSESLLTQGRLTLERKFVDWQVSDKVIFSSWLQMKEVVLFNHKIVFDKFVHIVPFDNCRYVTTNGGFVNFKIVSYDHPTVYGTIEPGYIYKFEHPFPVRGNVD